MTTIGNITVGPLDTTVITTDFLPTDGPEMSTGYMIWGIISTIAFITCALVAIYIYHRYKRISLQTQYTVIADTSLPSIPCLS